MPRRQRKAVDPGCYQRHLIGRVTHNKEIISQAAVEQPDIIIFASCSLFTEWLIYSLMQLHISDFPLRNKNRAAESSHRIAF